MGIFDRIKRIVRANVNSDSRSFDDVLSDSDEELRRLIDELNKPREKETRSNGPRQQSSSSQRQKAQVNVVYKAYQVLGLSPNATVDQIKTSYRKLMREYHPDMMMNAAQQKQDEAKKKAQEINLAYEVLAKVRGFK